MTVRELLSMGDNINYGSTLVKICDANGGVVEGLPGELPENVKNAHVRMYYIDGLKNYNVTEIIIHIEELYIL